MPRGRPKKSTSSKDQSASKIPSATSAKTVQPSESIVKTKDGQRFVKVEDVESLEGGVGAHLVVLPPDEEDPVQFHRIAWRRILAHEVRPPQVTRCAVRSGTKFTPTGHSNQPK